MLSPACNNAASSLRGEKATAQGEESSQSEEAQGQPKKAGRAVEGGHAPCSQQGPDVPIGQPTAGLEPAGAARTGVSPATGHAGHGSTNSHPPPASPGGRRMGSFMPPFMLPFCPCHKALVSASPAVPAPKRSLWPWQSTRSAQSCVTNHEPARMF